MTAPQEQEARALVLATLLRHLNTGEAALSHALALMPDDPDFYAADLALDQLIDQLGGIQAGLSRL